MRRLDRIFRPDGRTVVVAMDHGMGLHVNPELDETGEILRKVIAGGADAVLVTYGIARAFEKILRDVAVIVRVDGGGSQLGDGTNGPSLLYTVEDALRLGADGVVCMGFPGTPYEHETMRTLTEIVSEAHSWNVPVIAEMLPGGFGPTPPKTVENLRLAARTGCEYGADIIKTTFAGTPEEFKKVIDASYQPVIVLGGEKTTDLRGLFVCVEQAISVGSAGVAIGRNVWKHSSPDKVTAALVDIVHHGKKASDIDWLTI